LTVTVPGQVGGARWCGSQGPGHFPPHAHHCRHRRTATPGGRPWPPLSFVYVSVRALTVLARAASWLMSLPGDTQLGASLERALLFPIFCLNVHLRRVAAAGDARMSKYA
jgi:hypothetical protein